MSAPKQEEFDLLNVVTIAAVLLSFVAGATLAIAGDRAKLHFLLLLNGMEVAGKIVEPYGARALYRFTGPDGQIREAKRYISDRTVPHSGRGTVVKVLVYAPDPDWFAAEFERPGLRINFYIAAGAVLFALLSVLACTYAWVRRFRLREKLKRY